MLDRCTRFHLDSRRRFSAYFVFGLLGALVGSVAVLALGHRVGHPVTLSAIAIVAAPLSFVVAIKVSHLFRGREVLVMSEKLAAALIGTALAAKLLGVSVLATLDLAALGIGAFLIFGRLGCAGASCCFGRPRKRGLQYSADHARAGFPRGLVGVPLFPIQLVESLAHALLTIATAIAMLELSPGGAWVLYLVGYSLIRLASEVARGDAARSIFLGLSETQWIAGFTLGGIALAVSELRPTLLGVAIGALAIAFSIQRRRLSARQIEEIASTLIALGPPTTSVTSGTTSSGLVLSRNVEDGVTHYAFSRTEPVLTANDSGKIARLIPLLTDGAPLRLLTVSRTNTHHFETTGSRFDNDAGH